MSEILFQITMGTGLALAIITPKPGASLVLAPSNPKDPNQQWSYLFDPATQASILVNPASNMYAAPQNIEKGAHIVLSPMPVSVSGGLPFTNANTWQVLGANASAIRPPADTGLNMNALGSQWPAGTTVGLWKWDHGQPNEVWTSTPVTVG